MRTAPANATIPVRLTPDDLARFDALAKVLSARVGGMKVSRSELMRMIFSKGIPVLEAELGAAPKAAKGKR